MSARIGAIEYFLPNKIVSNVDIETEFGDWSAEKIEEKTGIRNRHVALNTETSLDLAYEAAKKIFQNYPKEKIDFLLLCTQSPDYFLPTSACILQDKLGLRTDIGALDFNLGCSGFIYGLALAKGLIESQTANNVLLLTAETYTKMIHPKDRGNRTIFGDGAAATIVERSGEDQIYKFVLGTDGQGYKNLIVPNGAFRTKYDPHAIAETDDNGNTRTENHLFMNGPEIFNFTIKSVPRLVSSILEKNNTNLNSVDYVIFHQANKFMIEYLRKKIKIPAEKFYLNMKETGNTVSSTIPIALKDCLEQRILKPDDKVLLAGFGVGYSWGGTMIRI
jgi:3-oxoacyl-[acyl-carrier-protein] synthase-3